VDSAGGAAGGETSCAVRKKTRAIFDFAVIDIISGHVRCPVIDAALKCGRALFELKIAAEEAAHSRCRAPCLRARPRVVVAHQRRPFLEVIGGGRAPERV
jgi:hypothetical protein